eukprot:3939782-Rhodomonas_salina.1
MTLTETPDTPNTTKHRHKSAAPAGCLPTFQHLGPQFSTGASPHHGNVTERLNPAHPQKA